MQEVYIHQYGARERRRRRRQRRMIVLYSIIAAPVIYLAYSVVAG